MHPAHKYFLFSSNWLISGQNEGKTIDKDKHTDISKDIVCKYVLSSTHITTAGINETKLYP